MEPNPMDISEKEYTAKREELLRELTPEQAAVFLLVENLWKLEKTADQSVEKIHQIRFDRGVTTEMILMDALVGFPEALPVPPDEFPRYSGFKWDVSLEGRSSPFDVRIRRSENGLNINANLGKFEEIESSLETVVGKIPYPILVWDDWGFRYENAAMRARTTK